MTTQEAKQVLENIMQKGWDTAKELIGPSTRQLTPEQERVFFQIYGLGFMDGAESKIAKAIHK
jgi:hypothetical protein